MALPLLANHVFFAVLFVCHVTPGQSSRVHFSQMEDWPEEQHKPLELVGISPAEMDEAFCSRVRVYLQADVAALKRLKYLAEEDFTRLFNNAVRGRFTDAEISGRMGRKGVSALFTALGGGLSLHPIAIGTSAVATMIPSWGTSTVTGVISMFEFFTDFATSMGDILKWGEHAKLRYIKDATFGNLWQSMAMVNGFQLVPKTESVLLLNDNHDVMENYTLPENAVLTPRRAPNASNYSLVEVSWREGQRVRSGWVNLSDVQSSIFVAHEPLAVYAFPVEEIDSVTTLNPGEMFAVSSNVWHNNASGEKMWWMVLADGRGYVKKNGEGYQGPLDEELHWERHEGNEALRMLYGAHTHWGATLGRAGFGAAMFTAGFFTAGLTWGIATAVDTADTLQGAALEKEALTDLDYKVTYLMRDLREWELSIITNASRICRLGGERCPEGFKCTREWAFFDFQQASFDGWGWCVEGNRKEVDDGEFCLVHADCKSANCQWPAGCHGTECFREGSCQAPTWTWDQQ